MKKLITILAAGLFSLSAIGQTYPSPTFSSVTLQTPLSSANGGTGTTTSTGTGSVVLSTSPAIASPTVTGSFTATGLVTTADHATQSANTILANGTGSTASPTALSVPSCSVAGTALQWTAGTGPTCATGYTTNTTATNQASTGQVFSNLGARIDRMNDRLFLGTATLNDGLSSQAVGDWTFNQYSVSGVGAFAYLEHNGTMNVGSPNGQPTLIAATRASDSGAAGNAAIGISSVVVNDNTIGAGADAWNYYATAVRAVGATGASTLGFETDMTNLGTLVPIFPSNMFPNGVTANLWVAAGGELPSQTGNTYTFNNVSAAIGIFANAPGSPTPATQYDKGIVFGAGGIASSIAIAMPTNYTMSWFNASNGQTNAIFSSALLSDAPHSQKIQFSDNGMLVVDGSGNPQFRVLNGITSAANYIATTAAVTGSSPIVSANGTDTNVTLTLQGQGTGTVVMPQNDILTYTNTSGQSIANSSQVQISGWTKTFDRVNANFSASTGTFTAPSTGFYHISGQLTYASHTGVVGAEYAAILVANGANVAVGTFFQESTSTAFVSVPVSADVSLAAGQTASIQTFQNSGAAVALATTGGANFLSIHRLP